MEVKIITRMEEIPMFCQEELEDIAKEEIIQAYLSLKGRFLEQLAADTEKDRLIKTLSERRNLDCAKQFGRSTETSAAFSGKSSEGEPAKTAVLDVPKEPAPVTAGPPKKKTHRRKRGCAQRIKERLPVKEVVVTLPLERLNELFENYHWRELPGQSYNVLRYRKACLYIERRHIHIYTAGGKVVRAGKTDKMTPKSLVSPEVLAGILDAKFVMDKRSKRFSLPGISSSPYSINPPH